jgi:exodeoxyribonuclease VIII
MKNELYPDVMLDIESFGTGSDAIVVSIGAVRFRLDTEDDFDTIKEEERSFYAVLDTEEQEADGRKSDPATMDWWNEQSAEARDVLRQPVEDTTDALNRFVRFCRGCTRIWGNGNMFDNAIVRDICTDYGVEYPVKYWSDLDVRTLTYLWNKLTGWTLKGKRPDLKVGDAHNALDDARSQVLQVQRMFKELRGTKYGA